MKNKRVIKLRRAFVFGLVLTFALGCERDLSDDVVDATFSRQGDVFIDTPVGMGTDFYFPFEGSKEEAATFDGEGYQSTASVRVDVPNPNDLAGDYAGAILRVDGVGRDLSGFDALTFWAKASRGVNLDQVGFGLDFVEDKYRVTKENLTVGTNWAKYVIPIPDASKLIEERGMFWYSSGTDLNSDSAYVIWFDDIKFESLGTIAQPRPAIFNGNNLEETTFVGSVRPINGLSQTFNLGSGLDQSVAPSPQYFDFDSSNTSVATVSDLGVVTIVGTSSLNSEGELIPTIISASLNGLAAEGSLTLLSLGDFTQAPIPTRDPSRVISLFSDVYTNVPVDYYNGFFAGDGQTTQGGAPPINIGGGQVISYTDLNFVGIGTFLEVPTIDATEMTHFHIDLNVQDETIQPSDFIKLRILNGVQTDSETLGEFFIPAIDLLGYSGGEELPVNPFEDPPRGWSSFDIPLSSFSGLGARDALGLIFLVSDTTISNVYVDNIYYYSVPTSPTDAPEAPTEDEVINNVISVFSDVYTNIANDGLNNFESGSILTLETIASNDILQYTNLNFTGLEFLDANIIDASASTTMHLDVWSPDANGFKIKLVDFGADGAFGGGDDTEHEINLGATVTNQWVSYDILLSDFVGLASTQNLAQIIFVNNPAGTLFVDNIYFYSN
jgi:hypothetical protein